ncbi:mitochondrial import receptor subunit Tom22-domain-containing protein [Protomyces lactucae-debilis]|uniref:Mitochondrial import receptor subunit Tom22-domain-containing protein n=1 Tax=Protomyces lactucae-debilis TaxID=2754530 RepID=A0A1Y2FT13_PROLT|nr:mitochondrial import receptor subunit Tom22-domain-containing protein [Protomyces lactucae-debilis]ORY86326.1 mitochondrial import receptor subunit Tom22-domain-containing protein [Protomyces lactucae-debilis]
MRLEEVTDEYDLQVEQDDAYTDVSSESELSEDEDEGPLDETLYERVAALKDIIPPPTRAKISSAFSKTKYGVSTVALYGGKSLWVITSSLLLLGIPFMMAVEAEAQVVEEEKAISMQAGGNDLLAPGTSGAVFQAPGQQQGQAVKPPGF